MAFTLSNLVQSVFSDLGQIEGTFGLFDATGGSATTFVNSNFNNFDTQPETDVFKNYLAIVVRDAAGASASPEGKWSVCSGYVDTTWTGTIATVTDAIASGDTIMLAKQDKFPLSQIIWAANKALESLGDLPANANISLTTADNQTEYAIPVAVKRGLKQVWIQGVTDDANDNEWIQVHDSRNELTTGGTASILYLPQYPSGYVIRLIYTGAHPILSAYSDVINEYVHPTVATNSTILKLLEWYNRLDANQSPDSYFLWLENEYRNKYLPLALAKNPIARPKRSPQYAVFGQSSATDSVPDPV